MKVNREFEVYQNSHPELSLNIGCGRNNDPKMYGIDLLDVPGVDLVHDITEGLPFPDNTFDRISAVDILEHVPMGTPNIKIMEEIYRVLKPEGEFYFSVPSTDGNNVGAFQDPTHISFWNQTKFQYFYADVVEGSFRGLYDIKASFIPKSIFTVYNKYGVTYVEGCFTKAALNG